MRNNVDWVQRGEASVMATIERFGKQTPRRPISLLVILISGRMSFAGVHQSLIGSEEPPLDTTPMLIARLYTY